MQYCSEDLRQTTMPGIIFLLNEVQSKYQSKNILLDHVVGFCFRICISKRLILLIANLRLFSCGQSTLPCTYKTGPVSTATDILDSDRKTV